LKDAKAKDTYGDFINNNPVLPPISNKKNENEMRNLERQLMN